MGYYDDDVYDYQERQRRYSPRRMVSDYRRSGTHLFPDYGYDGEGGLHRSRSQGHRPAPTVMVINENTQDAMLRSDSRSPPYPRPRYSPESRGRARLGDELADDLADLVLDRQRSRSRGRSDAVMYAGRQDYRDFELQQKEKELREIQRRQAWELEEKRIKMEMETQRLKDEAKRKADDEAAKAERKRIIDEYQDKQRRDADDAKAEKKRIIDEYELKQVKDEEERKAEEKRIKEKLDREAREKKEKEEREWEEFLRKQKEKEDKAKEEKKKEKEKVDEAMRKRLEEKGYSRATIDSMLAEKKEEEKTTSLQITLAQDRPSKIHKRFLDVKTLKFYQVPYSISTDTEYFIIHRSLDQYEIDVLCEHTRRLRTRDKTLLLEPATDEGNKFAWFRKRDRSTSRVRKEGILLYRK